MSRSHGSGIPNTLKCGKCKLKRDHNGFSHNGTLVRTGKTRPLRGDARGTGGARLLDEKIQVEYECLDCGHAGWTRHKDVMRKPMRIPF